jgi:hypothetical protein
MLVLELMLSSIFRMANEYHIEKRLYSDDVLIS